VVRDQASLGSRTKFHLEDRKSGDTIEVLCPPDEYIPLTEPTPSLEKRSSRFLSRLDLVLAMVCLVSWQATIQRRFSSFVSSAAFKTCH
jgi:hypothetical protein